MRSLSEIPILTADTVTKLDGRHRDSVLIGGSHGGIYAGYCAAKGGVRAVILNDAGVGKDRAGVGSLAYLDDLGRPAAVVDHGSARIGDAADMAARGMISHVNRLASELGCAAGQTAASCAEAMRRAPPATGEVPVYEEARFLLRATAGEPEVWGLDSASLVVGDDVGRVLICGSHGALLPGNAAAALGIEAFAAIFHDAGVGADGGGITRLPVLDRHGVAGATVAGTSARIGDARSVWQTGVISHLNPTARALGGRVGMSCQDFVAAILAGGAGGAGRAGRTGGGG